MNKIELACRKARRKIRGEIEAQAEAAKADIAIAFRRARARRHIPPFFVDSDKCLKLPLRFRCPECDGVALVEIHEWGTQDGIPTAGGYTIHCEAEDQELMDAMAQDRDVHWQHRHWADQGWMHLYHIVGRWLARNVRVRVDAAGVRHGS